MPAPSQFTDSSSNANNGTLNNIITTFDILSYSFPSTGSVLNDDTSNNNDGIFDDSQLAPVLLHANNITNNNFILKWTPLDNILHYIIEIATDLAFTSPIAYYNPKNNNYYEIGINAYEIVAETTLYARVRAFDNNLVTSYYSNTVTINKTAGTPRTALSQFINCIPYNTENYITDDLALHLDLTQSNMTFTPSKSFIYSGSTPPSYTSIDGSVLDGLSQWTFAMRIKYNGAVSSSKNVIFSNFSTGGQIFEFGIDTNVFYLKKDNSTTYTFTAGTVNLSDGLDHVIILEYDSSNGFYLYYDDMNTLFDQYLIGTVSRDWVGTDLFIGCRINSSSVPINNSGLNAFVCNISFHNTVLNSTERNDYKNIPSKL